MHINLKISLTNIHTPFMKAYLIQIYDEDMNNKISEIKETKGISIQDQFRKGLKLLIAEIEKESTQTKYRSCV